MMRALGAVIGIVAATALALLVVGEGSVSHAAGPAVGSYGQLPLSFEPNAGQTSASVDFLARGRNYEIWLMPGTSVVAVGDHVLRTRLIGARANARATGTARLPGKVSYLIGTDRAGWRTGIPTFAKVRYDDVYRGVDQVFYGTREGKLEYDFVVSPHVDTDRIAIGFDGVRGLSLDRRGNLLVRLGGRTIVQAKPLAYQIVRGAKRPVDAAYTIQGPRRVGFQVGHYDRSLPLVIDPVLLYSTYFGGSAGELGNGVAVDDAGSAYITGTTSSTDLPLLNPFQQVKRGFQDVYVTKLNASGSAILYSTYLGGGSGPSGEIAHGIVVDAAGSAYVTGVTGSSDFPTTPGSLQPTYQGQEDGFVTKLSADGSELVYSTYLGGSDGLDIGRDLVLDSAGNAYVTGDTDAADFPTTPGAYQPACGPGFGCSDAFLAKLDPTGSSLVWSTFLGAANNESGNDVALYDDAEPYLVGTTDSPGFPTTPGAFQQTCVGCEFLRSDAFVTRFDASGSALVFSSFLGGSIDDFGNGIAVDQASGDAVVTGETESASSSSRPFPTTPGAFDTTSNGIPDAFVTRIQANGKALDYSTYLGGSVGDQGFAVKLDESGNAYVIGETASRNFPTKDPIQAVCGCLQGGSTDAFVTQLDPAGSALLFSTYLGGLSADSGDDIVLQAGNAYAVGTTHAMDFPTTPGAFKRTNNGSADAFVSKIGFSQSQAPQIASFSPTGGRTGIDVTIEGSGFTNVKNVKLGTKRAEFRVVSETQIVAVVPDGATTSKITVTTALGSATSPEAFTVTLSITKLAPTKGKPGTVVTISGVGFADATGVAFDGVAAEFTVVSGKKIRATVPAGASTGPVTVTSPDGTVQSAKNFKVT
jgi:hypothetical protein